MVALVAARDLKRAAGGGELSDVDVLDVRAIDAEGDGVFRLAGGGARMAADAHRLIDDLPPLDRFGHGRKVSWGQVFPSANATGGRKSTSEALTPNYDSIRHI
jgi:hypothetical protein